MCRTCRRRVAIIIPGTLHRSPCYPLQPDRVGTKMDVVAHIGLPKTASTFLQRRVFSGHPDIAYFGPGSGGAVERALREIPRIAESDFVLGALRAECAPQIAAAPGRKTLFSSEALTEGTNISHKVRAQRLKALFNCDGVILVVRRQDELLESIYLQYAKGLGSKYSRLEPFGTWLEQLWANCESAAQMRRLRFYDIATAHAAVFGSDNVHVLLFEELRASPEAFLKRIYGIFDLNAASFAFVDTESRDNPRVSRGQFIAKKAFAFAPWLRPLLLAMPGRLKKVVKRGFGLDAPLEVVFPEELRPGLIALCGPQNQALAREWSLPLHRYGYPGVEAPSLPMK